MYLAISKFLLEMPSLSLERTTCQGKKKKKKWGEGESDCEIILMLFLLFPVFREFP